MHVVSFLFQTFDQRLTPNHHRLQSGTEDPLDFTGGVLVVVLALTLFIILWVYQHRKW